MSISVPVPRISNKDDKVGVVAWHVIPGAQVKAGAPVVDLETAKTVVTVDAESAGFIQPLVARGAIVKVGDPLYMCAPTLAELDKAAQQKVPHSGVSSGSSSGPAAARHEFVPLSKQAEANALTQGESGNINSMLSVCFNSAGIRKRLQADQSFGGGIQPIILYELAQLLKSSPLLTSYFADNQIHYYDRVDLGLAVDLGKGLKVVTIKDAERLKPIDFAKKIVDIGMRYLRNAITEDELSGSTFTITDVSGVNVLYFHPLINGHQSAIIGIGGDATQPGHPMSINITFDHRIMSGREAGTFISELRTRILTYVPAEEEIPLQEPQPAFYPQLDAGGIRCDRCAIELSSYYSKFRRDGYMMPYFREDGSIGSVCHRCAAGWT